MRGKRYGGDFAGILFCILALTVGSAGFAADPFLGYLYPSGGRAGQHVRVLVGGQYLNVYSGVVTGGGVKIRRVTHVPGFPPPPWKQRQYLQKWIRNILDGDKKPPTLPEDKDIESWRKNAWWDKLDTLDPLELHLVIHDLYVRRNPLQSAPSIRQQVIVDLDIAPDAKPGVRELRLWGGGGVSNPKLFFIDAAPHTPEPEFMPTDMPAPAPPLVETFPAVLDGQIMPGETDRFRLRLERNTGYTMALTGRRLLPFIGDAVPGFFQAVLRLLGPDGKEVAFVDDEYFNPDPVLRYRPPASGEYTLEVRDNLYRGRADFVYRIEVDPEIRLYEFGTEPFPDLPRIASDDAAKQTLFADRVQVIVGTLRTAAPAVFRFQGKAGQKVVIDVDARRFGSPLDGVLRLYGPEGKLVAEEDDTPAKLNIGACLQQVDPCLALKLPASGEYRIELRDRTGQCGIDWKYRMRLGPPQPDFNVYTAKSMLNLYPGATGNLKLYVVGRDEFSGPIRLRAKGAVLVGNAVVPAGKSEFTVRLKNPATRMMSPAPVELFAEAVVNGEKVERKVIPCDEYTQAFAYTHLLPVEELSMGTLRPRGGGKRK